jgi:hypothetical protein
MANIPVAQPQITAVADKRKSRCLGAFSGEPGMIAPPVNSFLSNLAHGQQNLPMAILFTLAQVLA